MKESIAKRKLCPFFFQIQSIGKVSTSVATYCKGSECMLWDSEEVTEASNEKEKPAGDGWKKPDVTLRPAEWFRAVEGGSCGLKAGR